MLRKIHETSKNIDGNSMSQTKSELLLLGKFFMLFEVFTYQPHKHIYDYCTLYFRTPSLGSSNSHLSRNILTHTQ